MKKDIVPILSAIVLLLVCVLGGIGIVKSINESRLENPASIIEVDGGSINGQQVIINVDKNTDYVDLANIVHITEKSSWALYTSETILPIQSKQAENLKNGDNQFVILVTSDYKVDGDYIVNTYFVNINREYEINVQYYDGNKLLETHTITAQKYYSANYRPANKEGYTFKNWVDANGKIFRGEVLTESIKLYADMPINEYTIKYVDGKTGSEIFKEIQKYGSYTQKPNFVPEKEESTFLGWFERNTSTAYQFGERIDRNITLEARWDTNTYTIYFDENGGDEIFDITEEFGKAVMSPVPTREGYTFDGWYEEGSDVEYNIYRIENRDVNLIAKWLVNDYTITFDSDGGSYVPSITAPFGSILTKPEDPTKDGYDFMGWYEVIAEEDLEGDLEEDFGQVEPEGGVEDLDQVIVEEYVFDTVEARDIQLKAKWKERGYTVTFYDGTTQVCKFEQDFGTFVSTPILEKEGYTFLGWYEEGSDTAYEFDTIESRDIKLYAKWEENQ